MNNLEKLSLNLNKSVNNLELEKLISNIKHNISKDYFIQSYKNYDFDFGDYIGFDLESLEFYENWLGDKIGRN